MSGLFWDFFPRREFVFNLSIEIMRCLYLLVVVLFVVCAAGTAKSRLNTEVGISDDADTTVVRQLKDFYTSLQPASRQEGKMEWSSMAFFVEKIDQYKVMRLNYLVLDKEKIQKDSFHRRLSESLYLPENERCFLAYGVDTVLFTAVKQDSVWVPRTFIPKWGKTVSWLPEKLKAAGTNDYNIFELGGNIYISFKWNGEYVYYMVNGLQEWSESQFCNVVSKNLN